MSSEDNYQKSMHGVGARKALASALQALKENGSVLEWREKPTYGYAGFNPCQFKAAEEVVLADGMKLILYSTNSIRSDRVKEGQWDAYNIKQIDESVEAAWIVVPGEEALKEGLPVRNRLRSGEEFTAIDDIVTVEELYRRISDRRVKLMGKGKKNDFEGKDFEKNFARILSDEANLSRYNGEETSVGYQYDVFVEVMNTIGVDPDSVSSIETTTDIPKLPSGGSPKTDVAATLTMQAGGYRLETFSLKNSSRDRVSVHQYSADTFADVLDEDDEELRRLLRSFQAAGSASGMEEEDRKKLTSRLEPLKMKLDKWVFSGRGVEGLNGVQYADYLVVRDKGNGKVHIHSVEDYCSEQEVGNAGRAGFGTIFSWTYASGSRGKNIQLKAQIG